MYDTEGKTFYQLAIDPEFWRDLNPAMTISESGLNRAARPVEVSQAVIAEAKQTLIDEGYFKIEGLIDPAELEILARCATKLHSENWPETFAFVYDEVWQTFQRTNFVMAELLGRNFKQMPNLWMFFLECNSKSKGWLPHRDRARIRTLDSDGYPYSINIWLPITDATPDNGCMYILPAGCDENYSRDLMVMGVNSLQDVRALPTKAGDILGWNEAVYHWGGRSSKLAKQPRISMATNYQTTAVDPYEWPLIDPNTIPPFIDRLGIIGQQFLRYEVQNTYTPSTAALAKEIAALTEPFQHFDALNPYKKSKVTGLKKLLGLGKR